MIPNDSHETTKPMTNSGDQVKGDEEIIRRRLAFLAMTDAEKMKHCVFCGEEFGPNVCGHINCGGRLLDVKIPEHSAVQGEPHSMKQAGTIFGVEPYGEGDALVGACNLLDTIKQEWGEAWSEHEQRVRAGLSAIIIERHRLASLKPEAPQPIECKSDEGIVVGLIDSIITSATVAAKMLQKSTDDSIPQGIMDAFHDLFSCRDLRYLVSCGGQRNYEDEPDEFRKLMLQMYADLGADKFCDVSGLIKPEAPEGAKVTWRVDALRKPDGTWSEYAGNSCSEEYGRNTMKRELPPWQEDYALRLVKVTTTEEVISVREAGK